MPSATPPTGPWMNKPASASAPTATAARKRVSRDDRTADRLGRRFLRAGRARRARPARGGHLFVRVGGGRCRQGAEDLGDPVGLLVGEAGRAHVGPGDPAFAVDDEDRTTVEQRTEAVCGEDRAVDIGEERKGQATVLLEL